MASHRAATRAAALLAATAVVLLASPSRAPAQALEQLARRVAVIALPEAAAREVLAANPFGIGLGVFPDGRDPVRFVREIGTNASPVERDEQAQPQNLAVALRSAGVVTVAGGMEGPAEIGEALRTVFQPGPGGGIREVRAVLEVFQFENADGADRVLRSRDGVFIVLGVGERTPLLVGLSTDAFRQQAALGILDGGIARRPGIVTPYDIAATILNQLGIAAPESSVGGVLTMDQAPDADRVIDGLAERLVRDADYAPGLAAVTVAFGGMSIIVGVALARLGRRGAGFRVAQGAVFVLPGWVLALFLPTGRWELRAVPVVAGALLGAALRLRDPIRTLAWIGFGSAVVFAALMAIAPLNPAGEPGLSIWGNPLVSWRFFGFQNVQAAIVASGVVVWGVVRGLAPAVLVFVAAGAAVVMGAPAVGANFVGVLTFLLGTSLAVSALARRRAAAWQFILSGAIAAGGFVVALLADAGSPVSHGGRAARRISSGGWSEAWNLVEGRVHLNVELMRDFWGGVVFVSILVVWMAALIVWGLRVDREPFRARVAVLGGAVMALASLVLEDSGFYSGAVLWFVAADAWLLATLAPSLTPRESFSPPDASG